MYTKCVCVVLSGRGDTTISIQHSMWNENENEIERERTKEHYKRTTTANRWSKNYRKRIIWSKHKNLIYYIHRLNTECYNRFIILDGKQNIKWTKKWMGRTPNSREPKREIKEEKKYKFIKHAYPNQKTSKNRYTQNTIASYLRRMSCEQ